MLAIDVSQNRVLSITTKSGRARVEVGKRISVVRALIVLSFPLYISPCIRVRVGCLCDAMSQSRTFVGLPDSQ